MATDIRQYDIFFAPLIPYDVYERDHKVGRKRRARGNRAVWVFVIHDCYLLIIDC